MLARPLLRLHTHLRCCVASASLSSAATSSNAAPPPPKTTSTSSESRRVVTVEEHTESLLRTPPTRMPKQLARIAAAVRLRFTKDAVDPTLKGLLDSASAQLYYDCANHFDYEKLCASFGLPDFMSSWYKLTLMHVWMVLMRVHVSLDAHAYMRLQRGMLSSMWLDVDKRLEIVGTELGQSVSSQSDMKHMHGLHLQTFMEYDEGFLASDARLAGALWRCLYVQRDVDPVHVARTVTYMRSTVAWLDTLDLQDILVEGVKEWKQLPPKELVE